MSIVTGLVAGLGGMLLKGLLGKSAPKALAPAPAANPLPTANRDDARTQTQRDDELRRRKGAAADLITGSGGAEASAASLGKLVVGS